MIVIHLFFQHDFLDDANYQLVHDGLRIDRVEMSNNDTYWCRADVLETGESRDYPITVIVSSKLIDFCVLLKFLIDLIKQIEPISETRVTCAEPCAIEKKTATLICEASGLPSAKYLWYYGSVCFIHFHCSPLIERLNKEMISVHL